MAIQARRGRWTADRGHGVREEEAIERFGEVSGRPWS